MVGLGIVLGISALIAVIGVGAVIAMISAGEGARSKLNDRLDSVGKNPASNQTPRTPR